MITLGLPRFDSNPSGSIHSPLFNSPFNKISEYLSGTEASNLGSAFAKEETESADFGRFPELHRQHYFAPVVLFDRQTVDPNAWQQVSVYQQSEKRARATTGYRTFHAQPTGPVQFLTKLLHTWDLETSDAVTLLGFEESDQDYLEKILKGYETLRGRDVKDRIVYLFEIRKNLFALLRDTRAENEWLREEHVMLNGKVPLSLLLEGSIKNMLLVMEYSQAAAGM